MKKFAFFASVFIVVCSLLLNTQKANAWHHHRGWGHGWRHRGGWYGPRSYWGRPYGYGYRRPGIGFSFNI